MASLDEKLEAYAESDFYPFHMPGHKRNKSVLHGRARADITEIAGFDDLYHASEILKEAQERAAKLYGAGRSFYLVNGSTVGILTAIFAATKPKDRILMARNCHRSAYHGAILRQLQVGYLYPETDQSGINGPITLEMAREAFQKYPDAKALILPSPTYDGLVSDIAGLARIVHEHGAILIVDEAHGSHFGMHPAFPESSVRLGADLVIQSLHKTLPSYTQTALLHCNKAELEANVERHLRIFMTSSPSYLFMAGMDECIIRMQTEGKDLLERLSQMADAFYEKTADLKHLHVMRPKEMLDKGAYDFDKSRFVIHAGDGMNGAQLDERLRQEFHLEMEMAAGSYVIAITSVMDTEEGFQRLAEALHEIDRTYPLSEKQEERKVLTGEASAEEKEAKAENAAEGILSTVEKAERPEKEEAKMAMHEAFYAESQSIPLEDAVGQILSEFIYIYPPGIPEVVPGERLSQESLEKILYWKKIGLDLQGMEDPRADRIRIVKE